MVNSKNKISSKKFHLIFMLCLVFFSSCGGNGHSFIVWNAMDIIGLCIFGLIVIVVAILFGVAAIQDWWNARVRRRKKH
jgi:hypothetical protein